MTAPESDSVDDDAPLTADAPAGRRPSRVRGAWAMAPVTVTLIILNVAVWLTLAVSPDRPALAAIFALTPASVAEGGVWQLVTSAFTHLELAHLGFNMIALWFLGPALESFLGRWRYLGLYLLSALTGSVAVYWLSEPWQATVGASGAIFGLMGALLVIAWRRGGRVGELLGWIVANVAFTVLGGPQISWQGHLGGLLGGAALAAALMGSRAARRDPTPAAYGAALLLLVALVAARTWLLGA